MRAARRRGSALRVRVRPPPLVGVPVRFAAIHSETQRAINRLMGRAGLFRGRFVTSMSNRQKHRQNPRLRPCRIFFNLLSSVHKPAHEIGKNIGKNAYENGH